MERPTLVFVPGFMQRADAWAPVAQRLPERYPRVLLDHATWTRDERIAEIRGAAPEGAIVVGYSLGGRLALHAALAEPGRWKGLVLVGVSAGVEDPAARRLADDELANWIERNSIEKVVERWESQPVLASQPEPIRAAQRPARLGHDPRLLAQLLRSAGQGAVPPVWEMLPRLGIPTLCLAGARDPVYVAAGRRMAELLPRGVFAPIPRSGHAPQLENPEAVAVTLRTFLERHDAKSWQT